MSLLFCIVSVYAITIYCKCVRANKILSIHAECLNPNGEAVNNINFIVFGGTTGIQTPENYRSQGDHTRLDIKPLVECAG